MAELLLIRHAQAAFGAEDYDRLSDLGRAQARAVGQLLRDMGWVPDRVLTGRLRRQRDTLAGMGFSTPWQEHAGFDEYDFHDLLRVKFGGEMPEPVRRDRRAHFRALRETLLEWQRGGLAGAKESWHDFVARVAAARELAVAGGAKRVLVVSSGGPIAQLVASALQAPPEVMVALNLQLRNTSMTRLVFGRGRISLHEFNAAPHFASAAGAKLMSYS